jgi:hypothetical protein
MRPERDASRVPGRLPLLLLASSVFLAGCAYQIIRGGAVDASKAQTVANGIEEIRDLRFKEQVPIVVKSADAAEALMEADLARDYTDEQLQVEGAAGALVGLYPAGMDLKSQSLKLLKSQVAGFYDPHTKEMVLVEGGGDLGFWNNASQFLVQRDVVGEMILAHELTHALQDQNFGLEKKLDADKDNDDRALALKSVAEGDATIAGLAYVMGRMNQATLDELVSRLDTLPQAFAAESAGTPEGLSTPLLFQYSQGVKFVAEAYRRGGWRAVDALYGNPPLSSRQIIHPTLYFDHPAPPLVISLKGYEQVMRSWTKADDDTYGELLLRVILERNLGKQAPELSLAQAWAGDRMIVLREGRGLTVIWMIAFADDQSAAHFAAVYATILDKLLGSTPHAMDYRQSAVLVVIGEGASYFGSLEPTIWKETTMAPAQQTKPPPTVHLESTRYERPEVHPGN